MLSGVTPFKNANKKQVLKDIQEKKIVIELFSKEANSLLNGLLCHDVKIILKCRLKKD